VPFDAGDVTSLYGQREAPWRQFRVPLSAIAYPDRPGAGG